MTTFAEFKYQRPDIDSTKTQLQSLIQEIAEAESADQAYASILEFQKIQNTILTQEYLAGIRHSIDTRDEYYKTEFEFWNETSPIIREWITNYYRTVLESPFRKELEAKIPITFFLKAEQGLKIFTPEIIPLLQKENKLMSEYNSLMAGAEVDYKGERHNLVSLSAFEKSPDRELRKDVSHFTGEFLLTLQPELDRIFDDLVKTRDQIAKALGFNDFVEVGYLRMNRLDFDRQAVEQYRKDIVKYAVPIGQKIFKRQQERLGLDSFKCYDLPLNFIDGNAKPQGTYDDTLASAVDFYHELSPETATFIDFMVDKKLFDLDTKPGKQGAGYCQYLPDFQSPFVFSNFNGTAWDVEVMTHEFGHAFQIYTSRWITNNESIWPTYESCEIHSTSMEFMAYPAMEKFFGKDATKHKFTHLADSVKFLPYGALVDHFQHEVYEHPEMTPEERRQTWRKLEKMYLPWKDYDGIQFYEEGGYWFNQRHIFVSPFYYIDYTLAQICAYQFWLKMVIKEDKSAFNDYLEICRIGGSLPFLDIVKAAKLDSPFKEGCLENIMSEIDTYLENIPEESFVQ